MTSADEARALHELGLDLAGRLEFAAAVDALRAALALRPHDVDAQYTLARVLTQSSQLTDAIVEFDRLLSLVPDFAQGHFEKGTVLAELARTNEAIDSFRMALSLSPNDVYALNHLALALKSGGRVKEAEHLLRKAIALRPEMGDAYHNLTGILGAQERWHDVSELLHRGIEAAKEGSTASRLCFDLGAAFWEQGRLMEAKAMFVDAVERDQDFLDARVMLAGVLSALNDPCSAESVLHDVIALDPQHVTALCLLASLQVKSSRRTEAKRLFDQALAIDPECLDRDPDWRASYEAVT